MITRQQIVDQARKYIDTPFQHQGRVLGKSMDCVGLFLCIGEDLSIKDREGIPFLRNDYPGYSDQPEGGFVHAECKRRMTAKSNKDLKAGDVVTMRIPSEPCHCGVITERKGVLYIVHAYNGGAYKVVEHIIDHSWRRRIVGAFSIPGVEL